MSTIASFLDWLVETYSRESIFWTILGVTMAGIVVYFLPKIMKPLFDDFHKMRTLRNEILSYAEQGWTNKHTLRSKLEHKYPKKILDAVFENVPSNTIDIEQDDLSAMIESDVLRYVKCVKSYGFSPRVVETSLREKGAREDLIKQVMKAYEEQQIAP